jgi:hypothetical protein
VSPKKAAARATREKVAQMRAAERRKQRRNNLIMVAVVVVVVGILGGGAAFAIIQQNADRREGSAEASGVRTFTGLTQNHVAGTVNYAQTPPVGGDHHAQWQNCGIYNQPVRNENAVHSLEHGAVWITYRPGLAAGQVDRLQDLVRGKPFTLLSPFDGLPSPIVASAWGKQLTVTDAGDSRLNTFIRDYAQSPDAPEPGAPCTNGVGQPQST